MDDTVFPYPGTALPQFPVQGSSNTILQIMAYAQKRKPQTST